MFTCKYLSKQLGSKCSEHMPKLLSFGSTIFYIYKPHKNVTVTQIQRQNPENYGEKCDIQCLDKIITLKVFFLINDR